MVTPLLCTTTTAAGQPLVYPITDQLHVEMKNGKSIHLSPGQAMAESIMLLHNGKNTGTEPVKLVMFVMGEEKKPFTVRPQPKQTVEKPRNEKSEEADGNECGQAGSGGKKTLTGGSPFATRPRCGSGSGCTPFPHPALPDLKMTGRFSFRSFTTVC